MDPISFKSAQQVNSLLRCFRYSLYLRALRFRSTAGLGLLVALIFSLGGCQADNDRRVLKMAHSLSTDHPVHQAILFLARRVSELSDGQLTMDVYSGGQLGNERELMELLQIGSLAMTKVSSSPMEGFVPEMKVFSMPYVFRDSDHFWSVLNGPIGRELLDAGESVRLKGLGYYDAGSRSFYMVDTPVHRPEDLQGLKIRVQQSQTSIRMINTLGGAGTPVSFGELYTALDQGVVDGAENNPPSFYSSRHYEVARYYSLDEHSYVPDIILISSYIWNSLTEQEQGWLQQAVDESVVYQRELWGKASAEALEAVKAAGVELIYPDKSLFAQKVEPMYETLRGEPAYDLIQAIKGQVGVDRQEADSGQRQEADSSRQEATP